MNSGRHIVSMTTASFLLAAITDGLWTWLHFYERAHRPFGESAINIYAGKVDRSLFSSTGDIVQMSGTVSRTVVLGQSVLVMRGVTWSRTTIGPYL